MPDDLFDEQDRETFREAVDTWGIEAQGRQVQEECAELIVAVNHWSRGEPGAIDDVLEELADVRLMLEQLTEYLGRDDVEAAIDESMGEIRRKVNRAQRGRHG
jgi:NTP pyrophosphatase (non-canonical NTP hydrolase)